MQVCAKLTLIGLFGLLTSPAILGAGELPSLLDASLINELLEPTRQVCSEPMALGQVLDCPGLPPILDPAAPQEVQDLSKYRISDSLLHANCPNSREFSTCAPLTTPPGGQFISGGMITSSARYAAKDLPTALLADKRVSDFASTTGGKFRGLCDISFYSHYGLDQIRQCLKLPGMVGVGELNFNGEGTFSSTHTQDKNRLLLGLGGLAYQRLRDIAATVQESGGGVIVMHLSNVSDPAAPKSEAEALLEIAASFPKVDFVIAHSGIFNQDGSDAFGLRGLREIGENYGSRPELPRNIWTDLSAIIGEQREENFPHRCALLQQQAAFASAWRAFGMERVLFATDDTIDSSGPQNEAWLKKSVAALVSNPFLSPTEKERILQGNLTRLLSKH